jgi:hypothetical protein
MHFQKPHCHKMARIARCGRAFPLACVTHNIFGESPEDVILGWIAGYHHAQDHAIQKYWMVFSLHERKYLSLLGSSREAAANSIDPCSRTPHY